MSYAALNRGELAVQVAHTPGDAADLIVALEQERDALKARADAQEYELRAADRERAERDALRLALDRYRRALEDAHDEMQANRVEDAIQIVLDALNQNEEGGRDS